MVRINKYYVVVVASPDRYIYLENETLERPMRDDWVGEDKDLSLFHLFKYNFNTINVFSCVSIFSFSPVISKKKRMCHFEHC